MNKDKETLQTSVIQFTNAIRLVKNTDASIFENKYDEIGQLIFLNNGTEYLIDKESRLANIYVFFDVSNIKNKKDLLKYLMKYRNEYQDKLKSIN